jgi:hypothetical protein
VLPFAPPPAGTGSIYVIEEKITRSFYPQGEDANTYPNCAALVSVLQANHYEGHGLYTIGSANNVDASQLKSPGVNLLVIEGCLPDATLTSADCGDMFDPNTGNLRYRIVPSLPVPIASENTGPGVLSFQAIMLSHRVQSAIDANQTVSFSFGLLDDPTGTRTPLKDFPGKFGTAVPSMPATTSFAGTDGTEYQTKGFVLTYGTSTLSQSLAQVQAQSSAHDLPQDFYLLPSNFVILIVGDPTVNPPAAGPGASLHFLAVPVRDPDTLADAGPEGGM